MNKPTNEYIMAIKPEWVALIESKEKTLEIRRTAPYISPPVSENNPIDVWVYETFLSTLSLRRATAKVHKTVGHFCAYETNFMEIASSC